MTEEIPQGHRGGIIFAAPEFRTYVEGDYAAVWRLHEEGLHQTGAHGGPGPWDHDLRSIRAAYLDNHGDFIVAVVNGRVVSMGALRRISGTVAEVKRMRVDRPLQGQGLGRAILQRLEARAQELGYRSVRLDTTSRQVVAQHLYRTSGYREISREPGPPGMEIIYFAKTLDECPS